MKYIYFISLSLLFISWNTPQLNEVYSKQSINISKDSENTITEVIEENGNIYAVYSTTERRQLTYNNSDYNPILLKDRNEVLFIRHTKVKEKYSDYTKKSLMIVDLSTLIEMVVTDKKSYKDEHNNTREILTIDNLTLAPDGRSVYFITEKWANTDQLVKVDLKSGRWTQLFGALDFELLTKDPYNGNFLIERREVSQNVKEVYFCLINEDGEILKTFNDDESYKKFKVDNI